MINGMQDVGASTIMCVQHVIHLMMSTLSFGRLCSRLRSTAAAFAYCATAKLPTVSMLKWNVQHHGDHPTVSLVESSA